PFGMRWGRMHTGIDIGVPYGTPIHAAASGQIIYAGWMDGYGNLVFVDHGHGLSTGYAHQSSMAVSNGQSVTQGQVIGYGGCTGAVGENLGETRFPPWAPFFLRPRRERCCGSRRAKPGFAGIWRSSIGARTSRASDGRVRLEQGLVEQEHVQAGDQCSDDRGD